MYLRRHRKKSGGVSYDTWTLVETVRTIRGPGQRIVATIRKLPGLDVEEKVGWEYVTRILNNKPKPTLSLLEKAPDVPEWATVNLRGIQVERLRPFGDVYLGRVLWHRLGLMDFCNKHMAPGREERPWSVMAAVLTLARFCSPSSEFQIAESCYGKTSLDDLLGMDVLLPTRDRTLRLSTVSKAPQPLRMLLQRLGLPLPNQPNAIENVVQNLAI